MDQFSVLVGNSPFYILGLTLNGAAIAAINNVSTKLLRHRIFVSFAVTNISMIFVSLIMEVILNIPNDLKYVMFALQVVWQALSIMECFNILLLVFDSFASILIGWKYEEFSETRWPFAIVTAVYPIATVAAIIFQAPNLTTPDEDNVGQLKLKHYKIVELAGLCFKLASLMLLIVLYAVVSFWSQRTFSTNDWSSNNEAKAYLLKLRQKLQSILASMFLIAAFFCTRAPLLTVILSGNSDSLVQFDYDRLNTFILFGCIVNPLLYCSLLREMMLPKLFRFPTPKRRQSNARRFTLAPSSYYESLNSGKTSMATLTTSVSRYSTCEK